MRVLVAPDSFKGSLSAAEAAACMRRGILRARPDAVCDLLPLADGGEGTVDAFLAAQGGARFHSTVQDPLGRPVRAAWALIRPNLAVVECAAASGLTLVPHARPTPQTALQSSSYGTGQLALKALTALAKADRTRKKLKKRRDPGAEEIANPLCPPHPPRLILGLGGSASTDGGSGALAALGVRFLDQDGRSLPPGGGALPNLAGVDPSGLTPLVEQVEICLASDVQNPLCGPQGAAAVFSPQKGAGPGEVILLEEALAHYARTLDALLPHKKGRAALPGAGAAGGLGAGFLYFTQATLESGCRLIMRSAGFAGRCALADVVLTGEGKTDAQTAWGKAPFTVAAEAGKLGKPTICLSGALDPTADYHPLFQAGIITLAQAAPPDLSPPQAMENAAALLEKAAYDLFFEMPWQIFKYS